MKFYISVFFEISSRKFDFHQTLTKLTGTLHEDLCKLTTVSRRIPACGTYPPPPPSSAEVLERVELYLYSPKGPSWPIKRVKPTYLAEFFLEPEFFPAKL